MKDLIFNVLSELGINFTECEKASCNEININDYIYDSLELITFAILLEEKTGLELTDEILNKNNLSSAENFSKILESLMKTN